MKKIPFHSKTAEHIKTSRKNPSHGILLHGSYGVGLYEVAQSICEGQQIAQNITPKNTKGDDDVAGVISIEVIRNLYIATRSKHTKKHFFIIQNSDSMSLSAQQAFLKLLEEPPENVHFILLTHSRNRLLPTILSRVQSFYIPPCTEDQSHVFLQSFKNLTAEEKAKIAFITHGRPALMQELATTPKLRKTYDEYTHDAKTYLFGNRLERIAIVTRYAKNKQQALQFIEAGLSILAYMLHTQPTKSSSEQAVALHNAKKNIEKNCQPRLQLLKCML